MYPPPFTRKPREELVMAESRTRKPKQEDEEIGGFNPERRTEKEKPQVGPAPTDDPHHAYRGEMKRKVDKKLPHQPPD